jgi:type II restriction/modification system DNA methylase subunit YeeA
MARISEPSPMSKIEATDEQIDALVYELYELTEEEIKIVEGI